MPLSITVTRYNGYVFQVLHKHFTNNTYFDFCDSDVIMEILLLKHNIFTWLFFISIKISLTVLDKAIQLHINMQKLQLGIYNLWSKLCKQDKAAELIGIRTSFNVI